MPEERCRRPVALEVRRSELALRAARLLVEAGLHNDALNRLYYALFHSMVALLLTQGVEPRRPRMLSTLLQAYIVPTGALTEADIAVVNLAHGYRDVADYERTREATAPMLADALAQIVPLLKRARARLEADGWVEERAET